MGMVTKVHSRTYDWRAKSYQQIVTVYYKSGEPQFEEFNTAWLSIVKKGNPRDVDNLDIPRPPEHTRGRLAFAERQRHRNSVSTHVPEIRSVPAVVGTVRRRRSQPRHRHGMMMVYEEHRHPIELVTRGLSFTNGSWANGPPQWVGTAPSITSAGTDSTLQLTYRNYYEDEDDDDLQFH